MMRNLKVLGAALASMLALGAVASSASAAEFTASETPVLLGASAISAGQVFTAEAGEVTCSEVDIKEGTVEESPTNMVTAVPVYGGSASYGESISSACEININEETLRGFVDFEGCAYTFWAATTEGVADVDIACPEGDQIRIRATAFKLGCYDIASQELSGVSYANNGNHIDLTAAVGGISYTKKGVCGSGEGTASYAGEVTVDGQNEGGGAVNLGYE